MRDDIGVRDLIVVRVLSQEVRKPFSTYLFFLSVPRHHPYKINTTNLMVGLWRLRREVRE